MSEEKDIRKAAFDSNVCTYWLFSYAFLLTISVVGIPLLLLYFPIGYAFTKRYLSMMECILTNKALKVKKGILVQREKTIPLEKITDMGMVQGPIMRYFDLHTLTIETAGQSVQGALVSLTGIIDAKSFREAVLYQRDVVSAALPHSDSEPVGQETLDTGSLLSEIRDTLLRIERKIENKSDR